ncbi:MAG TPA: hypothetical protein PKC28_11010, partial [Bdellovibrionales bacterium]|nr:hypothetical protein [Bdellovibrionales bacterium]
LPILATSLIAQLAWANSAVTIHSRLTSQEIYEIVTASEKTDTNKAPGIYSISRRRGEVLAVKGQVLDVGRGFNGVLTQFEGGGQGRYESLAVVNGRLTLFNQKSSAADPKSIVTLGESVPLLDAMTGTKVQLAPITSTAENDLTVQVIQEYDQNLELFLVSVKQPNLHGNGITFAAMIKRNSANLELAEEPIVIDYTFLSGSEIRKLYVGDFHLLSRNHILSAAQPVNGDDRITRRYRETLGRLAGELRGKQKQAADLKNRDKSVLKTLDPETGRPLSPPLLNMRTRRVSVAELPVYPLTLKPFPIYYRVDPFQNGSGLFFDKIDDHVRSGRAPANLNGRVDYDAKSHSFEIRDLSRAGKQIYPFKPEVAVSAVIDGRHHLIVHSPSSGMFRALDIEDLIPAEQMSSFKNVSAIVRETEPSKTNGANLHVIISRQGKQSPKTSVFKVADTKGYMRIVDSFDISNQYYDFTDLKNRLSEPSNAQILFDNVNKRLPKNGESLADNAKAVIESVPYLDLTESSSMSKRQIYKRPIRVSKISQGFEWRYYNPEGVIRKQSGFYLKTPDAIVQMGGNEPAETFVQGRLLTVDDQKTAMQTRGQKKKNKSKFLPDDFEPVVLDARLSLDNEERQLKVEMVPYLTGDQEAGAKVGFNLAIVIRDPMESEGVNPLLTTLTIPFPFKRFQGLKLIQGRRLASGDLSLIVFAGRDEEIADGVSPTRGGPGVAVFPIKFSVVRANPLDNVVFKVETDEVAWIHSGDLSPVAMKNRVTFDSAGNALWINNGELEKTDKNYNVSFLNRFRSEKPFFPNQGMNRVTIRYEETVDDEFDMSFRRESKWLVDYKQKLVTRFPSFGVFLDEIEKKKKAEEKENKKRRSRNVVKEVLFPDLNDYLNSLTETRHPNDHRVLLVDPGLYNEVRNLMMNRLLSNEEGNEFRLSSDKMRLHVYDPSFLPRETEENLARIGNNLSRKELLYIDMESLVQAEQANAPASLRKIEKTVADDESDEDAEENGDGTESEDAQDERQAAHDQDNKDDEREAEEDDSETDEGGRRAIETARMFADPQDQLFPYARLAYIPLQGEPISLRRYQSPLPHTRFTSFTLATPAQWRKMIESYPEEQQAGVFKNYKIDARFLTASWSVWSPRSSKATKETIEYHRNPISRDEYQVFQSLERLLTDFAKSGSGAKHQLLVVPEEIKPLVYKLIMTRWATDLRELNGDWNYKNKNLALYQVNSPAVTQETVIDNYESMHGSLVNRRPVLLADMADLLKIGRPGSENRPFRLRDPVSAGKNADGILNPLEMNQAEEAPAEGTLERSQLPHIIYMIASEGKKIQPKKARGWKLNQEVIPKIPTIIVTTQKELEELDQDTAFEQRFMDMKEMFQTVTLDKPVDEDKRRLVEDLFRRPEIASLQYGFRHENLPSEEARRQLIGLLIGKVEQISHQMGYESTYAFLKIYVTLKRALTEDAELRRLREIDSSYLFRLFSKVFPLPLSYSILRPDDPWQKLKDPDKAARGLQEIGYEGSIEFKARVVRGVTAHTRGGTEAGRKIPSSVVLIGEPGTGKSFIVESVVKLLGLKIYDFNKPQDEDVGAMFIRVQDIVEKDDPTHPEKISVDKLKAHISNFLSMPMGWRGLILFDDLHKAASTPILKEIMTFIQQLFEANNGLIKVRRMGVEANPGEIREIPVRNLQLAITLNPTKDKKKRERFLDRWESNNPVMEAVAALTRDNYQLEDSVFSRVGDVIDMSEFPREAKVPTLLNKIREANHHEFSSHPRVVAVTPRTLDVLVNAFPHSNARDFITPATYSLLSLPNHLPRAPIYIIDPTSDFLM